MSQPNSDVGEFAERLFRAQNFDEAFHAFEQQVYRLGFEGVLYTFIPRIVLETHSPKNLIYKVSDTYCPAYMSHYTEAQFGRDDPIVKTIAKGTLTPLDWWVEVKSGQMDEAGKNVIVTAREDYKVVNGLTLPLMSSARGIAGASFISSENDRLFEKLKSDSLDRLELSTRMFHAAVQSNALHAEPFIRPFIKELSQKERAVLRGLAEGKPMKRIAAELNTDIKYLDKVIRHAREKFSGVAVDETAKLNRNQLMYFAGLMSLLDWLDSQPDHTTRY
ncbi:MAG: autoinducer binding domain-containing protein [Gammaproteobacteria bacterium]|nr:autoinducer binding domain-containing protein [Gammaproteobacteria bacterium]MBU1654543.1 autoinducer binding domain-containing protein [Gammaproteobacteria bacterium]MBU1961935.1 autoinducer binding domain-containing protein [Gammaproteobacteria bacterium]